MCYASDPGLVTIIEISRIWSLTDDLRLPPIGSGLLLWFFFLCYKSSESETLAWDECVGRCRRNLKSKNMGWTNLVIQGDLPVVRFRVQPMDDSMAIKRWSKRIITISWVM